MKSLFGRASSTPLGCPPRGSFTMDLEGNIVFSTLPSTFPETLKERIGRAVLAAFGAAAQSKLRITEFTIHYASLRITAREMHKGVLVFLSPCGAPKKHSAA